MTGNRTGLAPDGPRIQSRLALPTDHRDRRTAAMLVVVLLLMSVLTGRLVQLQAVDAEVLATQGEAQRARAIDLPARRGRLYDRDGAVLATSVDSATIYADPIAFRPRELPDGRTVQPEVSAGAAARELAPLLGMPADELRPMLERDSRFVYLGRQLDWAVGEAVMELDLPGIGRLTEPRRTYPNGALGAQLLGFTGWDGEGLHGLESTHDDILAGRPGTLALEAAPQGLTIASGVREVVPPAAGTDLVLTIDREVQQHAEAAAAATMVEHDAAGASVLVLEIGTGEVIAAASTPGFDPADRGDDPSIWRNRAVTDVFEPGSVEKALTVAAAIEEGLVSSSTTFEVADTITIGPKTFRDSHRHPTEPMTVTEIMETSSNVGTMLVADQLGPERLHRYLEDFGYGRTLDVGLPGEAAGILPPVEDWWVTSLPTIAIGQGVAVTLLQAANAYATLGNGGLAVSPRILRGTVGVDGRLDPEPVGEGTRVVSADTAAQVVGMLSAVVDGDAGTGALAAVPGYRVGGKTGTARKPGPGGYTDKYIATFVGIAPLDAPRYVVAVMVDEPYPIYGGTVAAPVFSDVMEFTLRSRGIAPSSESTDLDTLFADAAVRRAEAEAAAAEQAAGGNATEASAVGSDGEDTGDTTSP